MQNAKETVKSFSASVNWIFLLIPFCVISFIYFVFIFQFIFSIDRNMNILIENRQVDSMENWNPY